jgi:hypothetical protein
MHAGIHSAAWAAGCSGAAARAGAAVRSRPISRASSGAAGSAARPIRTYVASRKAKQAALEQSQADLRKILTSRQEAIATLNGLL